MEKVNRNGIKVCREAGGDIKSLTKEMLATSQTGKLKPFQVVILRDMAKSDEAMHALKARNCRWRL